MQYHVIHRTTYSYRSDVSVSHHLARLTPRSLPFQRVLSHKLSIEPVPAAMSSREDYFGNTTTFLTVEVAHRELEITAESQVEVAPVPLPKPGETAEWEGLRELCQNSETGAAVSASEFLYRSPAVPCGAEFAAYALTCFTPGRPVLEAALELNTRIHADFKFDPRATTVATPLDQVMRLRRGVCQDFAHLQIACLRSIGLPARYVSGYLETKPPAGRARLIGSDASHAWSQVWCGDNGWIGLDPTNNTAQTTRHVVAAWGRDYTDVSPIRGVILGGGEHELSVAVDVLPMPTPSEKGRTDLGGQQQ